MSLFCLSFRLSDSPTQLHASFSVLSLIKKKLFRNDFLQDQLRVLLAAMNLEKYLNGFHPYWLFSKPRVLWLVNKGKPHEPFYLLLNTVFSDLTK